jgi:hypothetical protein
MPRPYYHRSRKDLFLEEYLPRIGRGEAFTEEAVQNWFRFNYEKFTHYSITWLLRNLAPNAWTKPRPGYDKLWRVAEGVYTRLGEQGSAPLDGGNVPPPPINRLSKPNIAPEAQEIALFFSDQRSPTSHLIDAGSVEEKFRHYKKKGIPMVLVASAEVENAVGAKSTLQQRFASKRIAGDWFKLTPAEESEARQFIQALQQQKRMEAPAKAEKSGIKVKKASILQPSPTSSPNGIRIWNERSALSKHGEGFLKDGAQVYQKALGIYGGKNISALLEALTIWADPKTEAALPIWYPNFFRSAKLHNSDKTPMYERGATIQKIEGNRRARWAFRQSIGLSQDYSTPNWEVCHIWAAATRHDNNPLIDNPAYYSRLSNLVMMPKKLHERVDSDPEAQFMLRMCAYYLYGWVCPDHSVKDEATRVKDDPPPANYPASWPSRSEPNTIPKTVVGMNGRIGDSIAKRNKQMHRDCWVLLTCPVCGYGAESAP